MMKDKGRGKKKGMKNKRRKKRGRRRQRRRGREEEDVYSSSSAGLNQYLCRKKAGLNTKNETKWSFFNGWSVSFLV